jgi:hypothetical protein
MKAFTLKRHSSLSQKNIFNISTNIENFDFIMPDYFKSLEIIEQKGNQITVFEKIKFMGINLKIKTKHVIIKPNIHKVFILTGPLKGTKFIETYASSKNGSDISIEVNLKFNRFMKIFSFLENYIANKMSAVMNEFISSAENFHSKNIYSQ